MQDRFRQCADMLDRRHYQACLAQVRELAREARTPEELYVAARVAGFADLPGLQHRLLRKALRATSCPPHVVLYQAATHVRLGRFLLAEELLAPHLDNETWPEADRVSALSTVAVSLAGRRRFRSAEAMQARAGALAATVSQTDRERLQLDQTVIKCFAEDFEGAAADLQKVVASGSAEPRTYELLAWCYESLGRAQEALAAMRACVERFPEYPPVYRSQAALGLELGELDLVERAARRHAALLATRGAERRLQRILRVLPQPDVRLKVPPLRQGFHHCFPACLTMALQFFGRPANQREIGRAVMNGSRGTPLYQAVAYLEAEGWACRTFRATPEKIRQLLDLGIPPILGIEYSGGAHVHICSGYDLAQEKFLIQDPAGIGMRWLRFRGFAEAYAQSDFWSLALVPADRAADLDFLPLEEDQQIRSVQRVYQALDQGDREAAEVALEQVRAELSPAGRHLLALRTWPPLGSEEAMRNAARELLEAFPDHRQIRLEVAQHLERVGDYEQAVAIVEEVAGFRQSSALQILVRAASRKGRPAAECTALWRRAHLRDPHNDRILADWGREELRAENYGQAESCFLAAQELAPSLAYEADLAELRRLRGEHARAVAAFKAVLKQERRYAWSWGHRAEAHWSLGQVRAAMRCYRICVAQDPEAEYSTGRLADLYVEVGRTEAALDLLKGSPCFDQAAFLPYKYCLITINRGRPAETVAVAAAAMERYPSDVRFPPLVAEGLRLQGQGAEALRILAELVQHNPASAYAAARFGRMLLLEGRAEEGIEQIARARALDPEWKEPLEWVLNAARTSANPDPVLTYVEKEAAGSAAARAEYGHLLLQMNKIPKARDTFRAALDKEPRLARARYGMALVAERSNDPDGYRRWMEKAVESATDEEEVCEYADRLGDILAGQKDYGPLDRFLEGLAGRVPEPWRLTYLGWSCELQERLGDAVIYYSRALELQKGYHWAMYRLPIALLGERDFEEALDSARAGVRRYPGNAPLLWVLGRCYHAVGMVTEAADAYVQALQADPEALHPARSLWDLYEGNWPALVTALNALPDKTRSAALGIAGDGWWEAVDRIRACAAYRAVVDINPDAVHAFLRLSEYELDEGRHQLAWERAIPAIVRNPREAAPWLDRLLASTEDWMSATALERIASQMSDEDKDLRAWVYRKLHDLHAKAGKREEALKAVAASLQDDPDNIYAVRALVQEPARWGRRQEVVDLLGPFVERRAIPTDMAFLARDFVQSALRLGLPRRPHWRDMIHSRLLYMWEKGERVGAEWDDLRQLLAQLEVEFGNFGAALRVRPIGDLLLSSSWVGGLILGNRLRPAPLDVRPGESTHPVVAPKGLFPFIAYRALRGSKLYRRAVEALSPITLLVRDNLALWIASLATSFLAVGITWVLVLLVLVAGAIALVLPLLPHVELTWVEREKPRHP